MRQYHLRVPTPLGPVLGGLFLLLSLYLVSIPGYILFHGLAEIFAIVISCAVFTLTWNTRRFLNNDYLLFVSIALLAASVLNALHTLSYKGMGVFAGEDANLPTQLWIARRYLESISLLSALWFLHRRLKLSVALVAFAVFTVLLLGSIFGHVFPAAYVEGVGLTTFKKVSEYVIAGIFLTAAFGLYRERAHFESDVSRALVWSLIIAAAAELLFTAYVGVYDLPNRLGHFLTIVSYYLIYVAIIRTGIVRPYTLLSSANAALSQREAELRVEVAEREQAQTALLQSREQLRALSHHLVNLQEAERKSLSRELHDGSGQNMMALKLHLRVLERTAGDPDAVRARVKDLMELADCVTSDLHDLAANLRPATLDRSGLAPAVEQYLGSFRKQHQVETEFLATALEGERLPAEVETAIYRIIQESLTNVARHARATHVSVAVTRREGEVEVTVKDDGRGFDAEEALARGRLGLLGMRERAEMLGGTLEIESKPGAGATVSARVMIHPPE